MKWRRSRVATSVIPLGGALLLELALLGKVDLTGPADEGRAGRVILRDISPTGDDVLDVALDLLSTRQGKKPRAVIRPLSKNLRPTLYRRLASRGVIRAETARPQSRTFGRRLPRFRPVEEVTAAIVGAVAGAAAAGAVGGSGSSG